MGTTARARSFASQSTMADIAKLSRAHCFQPVHEEGGRRGQGGPAEARGPPQRGDEPQGNLRPLRREVEERAREPQERYDGQPRRGEEGEEDEEVSVRL